MAHSTLTIRIAHQADLAAVDALLGTAYPVLLKPDYPASVLVTAVPLISRAQPRLLSSGNYYLMCDGDTVLGAGGWSWTAPQGGLGPVDMGHIRHVVTDHRRTRQGIGRRLMGHILTKAADAGVGQLDCLSTLTAVPLYSALGFQVIGPVDVRLRPGILFPAMRMQRRLEANL